MSTDKEITVNGISIDGFRVDELVEWVDTVEGTEEYDTSDEDLLATMKAYFPDWGNELY